jgi:NitT/TauT family transport system ATP-binding protein
LRELVSASPVIELVDVGKTYVTRRGENLEALAKTSLTMQSGEFVTMVGPSGCGKTTLLNIVCGLTSLTSGEVRVKRAQGSAENVEIGIVFQEPTLLLWRTVLRNVLLPIEIRKKPVEQYVARARDLLRTLGLAGFEDAYPHELSGGMQQRAAIARALINDPTLLLMDEPFSALDAFTRDRLNLELLRVWETTKKTVLFVTHNMAEAVFLADRVLVMAPRPGRVVADIPIELPRPRTADLSTSPELVRYIAEIREQMKAFGVVD